MGGEEENVDCAGVREGGVIGVGCATCVLCLREFGFLLVKWEGKVAAFRS